jgi:predicted CoA-binding protein
MVDPILKWLITHGYQIIPWDPSSKMVFQGSLALF